MRFDNSAPRDKEGHVEGSDEVGECSVGPMTAYVVTVGCYSDYTIDSVWTTKDAAQEYATRRNASSDSRGDGYEVEEYPLDTGGIKANYTWEAEWDWATDELRVYPIWESHDVYQWSNADYWAEWAPKIKTGHQHYNRMTRRGKDEESAKRSVLVLRDEVERMINGI